ncbi:MAG: 4Fe-4S binding protein [Bacteroidales bacterium]|nr:4Fe-4S binding protein [Bacteroidales bacterium]
MIRDIVTIDENLCNGCGECIPSCHEGALQIIDGKARLISDLMCDGLGACLGHCPMDAMTIEKREAEPYNETKVMEIMVEKGKNTVIAHLKHLKDHNETAFLKEGVKYLKENQDKISFNIQEVMSEVHNSGGHHHAEGGCPGSKAMSFNPQAVSVDSEAMVSGKSQLRQWPVQLHLVSPQAQYFQGADVVLAADCVAFSLGNFHEKYLKGKALAIACPKLDDGQDIYLDKIRSMIDDANINTLNVMIMQVPCCGGLLQMAKMAVEQASRKVPVKLTVVGIEGDILQEDWV